ncbi:MAG: hypothetical protein HY904_10915 [Deltaproteobacteria bacterium]|nr:hypothetical protein [Deltaproteobacteria bacterium]
MSDGKQARPHPARVPTGRLKRFTKLSGTATTVTARHAFQKLKEAVIAPEERAQSRRDATVKSAQDVVRTLSEMKGAAMKVGQLLSVDPQVLPPEFRDALGSLQKNAPPMPWELVEQVVTGALGTPLAEAYAEFDREPLGAASIGQVHRAVTRAGQPVAVKVQYPGIDATIDSDVKNLGTMLQMAKLVIPGARIEDYLEELRQVLHREADYENEARNLVEYAQRLAVFPYARVPSPLPELTRKSVLTMELMTGTPLVEVLSTSSPTERDALATRFLDMFMRMFHELNLLHADPHPGNFLMDGDGRLVLLDFGCVKTFDPSFPDAFTNIMRAQWRGEADGLLDLYRRAGFVVPARGVDGDLLYEWQEIVLEPFIHKGPFDFAAWKLEARALAFLRDNLVLKTVAPPRPALFYFRVCAGLRGILTRTGARVDVRQLARELEGRLAARGR